MAFRIAEINRNLIALSAAIAVVCLVLTGCEDPDPVADLKKSFKELKDSSSKFDELLASITDVESARNAVPELKKYKKKMLAAGFQVGLDKETNSRSATGLKIEIDQYRSKRKAAYQEELRRLAQLPGVADVLVPVLKQVDEDGVKPEGPPKK